MKSKFLYDKYRKQLINLHGLTVLIIAVAEIVAYLLLIYADAGTAQTRRTYLLFKVAIPIVINIMGCFAARYVSEKKKLSYDTKNAVVICISLLTAIVVAVSHKEIAVAFAAFVFPIFLAGMFNNKKYLNISFIAAIVLLSVDLFFVPNAYHGVETVVNYIAIYGIMIVAYLFGYISIDFHELNSMIIQNQAMTNDRLREKIKTDSMTGLYNREQMFIEIDRAILNNIENNSNFCFAMIDIDDFKTVNDTYGHIKGDAVLMRLSELILKYCSKGDMACRFGGDEFAVVFNNKRITEAQRITQKISKAFAASSYDFTDEKITISAGISEYRPGMTGEELFDAADDKLYSAKEEGKNRVCC